MKKICKLNLLLGLQEIPKDVIASFGDEALGENITENYRPVLDNESTINYP